MKALITRASAHLRNNRPMFSVTFKVTDGEYAGVEGTVYHHPRTDTEGQRTATRIFRECCPLERDEWGRDDLEVPCDVTRAVITEGGESYVDWSFAPAAVADADVLSLLDDDDEPEPTVAPTATRRKR